MTGKTGVKRIINGLKRRILKIQSSINESQRSTQISKSDIASFSLLLHLLFYLNIEEKNLSFLLLSQYCVLILASVFVYYRPEIGLIFKLRHVYFANF